MSRPIHEHLSFEVDGRVILRTGKVELGQGIDTALVHIVAQELDVRPDRIDLIAGDTSQTPDEGFTAGSLSIETTGQQLRMAAAAARRLFTDVFRARGGAGDTIVDGVFVGTGTGPYSSYWTLRPHVNLALVPDGLGAPKTFFSASPQHKPGVDLRTAVSGARFIHDFDLPGMLHARMIRSRNIQATLEHFPEDQVPPDVQVIRDGSFVGLLAQNEWRAITVAERIEARVRWSAPALVDPLAPFSINTRGDAPQPSVRPGQHAVEVSVSRDFLAHASMGPSCAIAMWQNRQLTVWTHSQGVFQLRSALAQLLELPVEAIRVIHLKGAGCYGHNGADDAAADAALLARAVPGQPVRVLWTRAQELGNSPLGPAMCTRVRAIVSDQGEFLHWTSSVTSAPHARRPSMFGGVNLLAGYLRSNPLQDPVEDVPASLGGAAMRNAVPAYRIGDIKVEGSLVCSPAIRTSALRTLGAHLNVVAVEAAIEQTAALFGQDPVAFRLQRLEDPRARSVLEHVRSMSQWSANPLMGVAYAQYKNKAAYCAAVVKIEFEKDVCVTDVWIAVDCGRVVDRDSVINQIEGGAVQGISWTLKEAVRLQGCVPMTDNGWDDYPILPFSETPRIRVDLIEMDSLPSLGVGEASTGPVSAAVRNAVSKASGVGVYKLPLTKDRLISAISGSS